VKKVFSLFGILVFIFFAYGVFLSVHDIQVVPDSHPAPHKDFWDYRAISHVVTKHTRGSLYPKDILIAAGNSKVDALFLTDLNLMKRPYSIHGYHGNVFVFTNQKVSYLDSHILIYSENRDFWFSSITSAQTQISDHLERHHFQETSPFLAVLAHPFKRKHQWSGDIPPGFDGIEVLNLRKLWKDVWDSDRANFLLSVFFYPFNPNLALMRILKDPIKELELWDRLNQKKQTIGLLGSETTARIFQLIGLNFSFPSYPQSFEFASNHLLLDSELTGVEDRDRKKLFSALQKGSFYFALDIFGSPKGFGAFVDSGKQRASLGESIPFKKGLKLQVDLPENVSVPWEVVLYKDGKKIKVSKDVHTRFPIEAKGVYRIAVRIKPNLPFPESSKWFTWIYTNNFFVTP